MKKETIKITPQKRRSAVAGEMLANKAFLPKTIPNKKKESKNNPPVDIEL